MQVWASVTAWLLGTGRSRTPTRWCSSSKKSTTDIAVREKLEGVQREPARYNLLPNKQGNKHTEEPEMLVEIGFLPSACIP